VRPSAATWPAEEVSGLRCLLRLLASEPWPRMRAAWTRPSIPCSPVTATTPKAQHTWGQAAVHLLRSWISRFASDDTHCLSLRGCFTVGDCRRLRVPLKPYSSERQCSQESLAEVFCYQRQLQHVAVNSFSSARAGPCGRDKPPTASLYMCTGRHAPEWLLASDVSDTERR